MGVFSRFLDIINSNINALLDNAEDPQKMIKLMINEMEDTIIEIKTNCAAAIGSENTAKRKVAELEGLIDRWQKRAELAISKGRDDLAREALLEKKKHSIELDRLKEESERYDALVKKYKEDIAQLEAKLASAKAKWQAMREQAAKEAEQRAREEHSSRYSYNYSNWGKAKSEDPVDHFSKMEERINKMNERKAQNESDKTTEDKFKDLEEQDEIESELEKLKKEMNG